MNTPSLMRLKNTWRRDHTRTAKRRVHTAEGTQPGTLPGTRRPAVLVPIMMALALAQHVSAQGVNIDSITPAAARHGETVTIKGRGFAALNVRIAVGGIPAALLAANGNQVTFRVPDAAPPGATTVTAANPAVNPGGQTGSIGFRVLEGILLPGSPSSKALAATFDILPVGVGRSLIQNGVFLTRIDVTLAPDATVDQVNQALVQVEGGIVTMTKGFAFVTVAVPQQPAAALERIAQTLSFAPGILAAFVGREPALQALPVDPSQFQDKHLLPTRFPAAWNAMHLALKGTGGATDDCANRKVPVLVPDDFQDFNTLPAAYNGFSAQVPGYTFADNDNGDETHGYDVTGVLAALFDAQAPTGANPFTQCLQVTLVHVSGLTWDDILHRIVRSFPSGRFILNFSQGFTEGVGAYNRANAALQWKEMTFKRWNEFFAAPSAGNDRHELDYTGFRLALYTSPLAVVTDPDTFWEFIQDTLLWKPVFPDRPDLTASAVQAFLLKAKIIFDGMDKVDPANNVLITGATTAGNTFVDLFTADYSNIGADASAVGAVHTFCCDQQGTSFAAPQVAGLASYLWLLSNDLRLNHPASDTRAAILQNSRQESPSLTVIDAYASVLSLDAAAPPTPAGAPVRLAILDVNNNFQFDENDINLFLSHFLDSGDHPVEPATPDYSRFDLNGDGFTGGTRTESFDLDRASSTQFGKTVYRVGVTQQIEGHVAFFNSNAVTDMGVLCYYAYSPLYTGSPTARTSLLAGHCGIKVTVSPKTVTLAPNATQQFTATVKGTTNTGVNWSATGGAITATGLFTAGTTAGSFKVRATSVENPDAFDEATVTVITAPPLLFTFDTGLEGWTPVPATQDGCFDLAQWRLAADVDIAGGGGVVVLDGTDFQPLPPPGHPILCNPIRGVDDHVPNSFIFRDISLPSQATTLEFDVAGHGVPTSSSEMRIRFLDRNGVFHIVLDWTTILGNQTPKSMPPQFSHRTIDISAFAGQTMEVYFEQGDDASGGASEIIYLDNIWFH